MAGMMYIPPKTNPFIGMGANFLSNLAMAGIARDWRKEDEKEKRPLEMLKAGYEQVQPEQAGTPTMVGTDLSRKQPGVVEVGGQFYKRRKEETLQPQAMTFKVGDRMIPAIVTQKKDGGYDVKLVPDEKREPKVGSMIEQYEYAQKQFNEGSGPDPGAFDQWALRHKKAGATRIGIEELTSKREAEKEVDRKSFVQTGAWDKQVLQNTAQKIGSYDWNILSPWEKEKATFETADVDIKNVYKDYNPYFGVGKDGKQGWYGTDPKTKKMTLIKQWGKEKKPNYGIPDELVSPRSQR